MSKQDRQGVRTINALEQKYYFDRKFSEVMGVANSAHTAAKKTAEQVTAELRLTIKKDENDKIVSMLNASADLIKLKGNRISIESDNFTLTEDGKITAKNGVFDNCEIKETCTIKGKLTGNTIASNEIKNAKGTLSFFNTDNGIYYDFNFSMSPFASGIRLGLNSWGGSNPSVFIYSESSTLTIGEKISASALGDIELGTSGKGILSGKWYYGGNEIATKSDLEELEARLKGA